MRISEISDPGDELITGVVPEIKYMPPDDITPTEDMSTQKKNLRWYLEDNPGTTAEDWARWILNFKNGKPSYDPVVVDWSGHEGWVFKILDGHHRWMSCKILGLPLRVELRAHIRRRQLNGLLGGYNDIGFDPITGKGNMK